MKKLLSLFLVLFLIPNVLLAQQTGRKIQIAILFDTSNSMDGLLEQAKTTIWQIVNAATKLRYNNETPKLEIAIYDYGNTGIQHPEFVRLQTNLVSDLDSISEILFGLRTNGGDEYCGAVIDKALDELAWSKDQNDLRLIYIAGNEPFNQGPKNYKTILQKAAEHQVVVNTIYCGIYEQGVKEFWMDGASITKGNYFNINSNKEVFSVPTPYDDSLRIYNDSLNKTYMSYGSYGKMRAEKQKKEDMNAGSKNAAAVSERAVSKSQTNYSNAKWDIIDAEKEETVKLAELKDEDLPDELKGKTLEEKQKIIDEKAKERQVYQQKILEANKKRMAFIEEERKKQATDSKEKDLGSSIIEAMNTNATQNGYSISAE